MYVVWFDFLDCHASNCDRVNEGDRRTPYGVSSENSWDDPPQGEKQSYELILGSRIQRGAN